MISSGFTHSFKSQQETQRGHCTNFLTVIEGLNREKQLPYFIMFLADQEIVLQTDHFKPGILFVLEKQLDWIFREVDRALTARRDNLLKWSPGAVGPEPTIIWVKMIKRPFIKFHPFPNYNTVVELANKFNNIVDQETRKSHFAISISPDIRIDAENFDNLGNLSFLGKTRFWKFIDAEIRSLDKDKKYTHRNSLH